MPRIADQALPLQHWCVLSLRPRGQHAGLRAAAARSGARTLALSPFAIEAGDDPTTRRALAHALAADIVLYTSPNAVAAAAAWHDRHGVVATPDLAAHTTPVRYQVDVPGGSVEVELGEQAYLTGPAVIVARGELSPPT